MAYENLDKYIFLGIGEYGMKHKQMRYEGIIDMDSDSVYWR